jgi:pimeloyl-ACP methyl ester carboxylesterase
MNAGNAMTVRSTSGARLHTEVHGRADRLTPLAHAHRMARGLPGDPKLIEIPGAGHMTPLEDPERLAKTLRRLAP